MKNNLFIFLCAFSCSLSAMQDSSESFIFFGDTEGYYPGGEVLHFTLHPHITLSEVRSGLSAPYIQNGINPTIILSGVDDVVLHDEEAAFRQLVDTHGAPVEVIISVPAAEE